MSTANAPTDITVDAYSPNTKRASAEWMLDGARYHFWYTVGTRSIQEGVIYKNPPRGINHRWQPGYFDTRRLDVTSAKQSAIVAHVFEVIESDRLEAKAIEAFEKAQRAERAKQAEERRAEKVRDAAPELLAALKLCEQYLDPDYQGGIASQAELLIDVRAAIAKATS